jgi:uncharacterized protein
MNREQITEILLQRADALRAIGATSLYMFGSRARGDNRPDSDLDLFIDYRNEPKRPSLLDIIAFERDIETIVGIPVHLTMRDSLHSIIANNIEKDSLQVF